MEGHPRVHSNDRSHQRGDLNHDGVVNGDDVQIIYDQWDEVPEQESKEHIATRGSGRRPPTAARVFLHLRA